MPGETRESLSGWTTDTLHVWVRTVMDERDRRYEQRFAAQEKATEVAVAGAREAGIKAENAIEKRLENTNEWRDAMNDRDRNLLPRQEYDRAHIDLEKRLEEYKKAMDERLSRITEHQKQNEGRALGLNAGWGYLVGALGVALALYVALKPAPAPTIQPTLPMQVAPQSQPQAIHR